MRKLLVDAIKARAMFYYAFYKEFSAEIGSEKTAELMKRAIYKRGLEIGKRFAKFAPDDMEGLKTASGGTTLSIGVKELALSVLPPSHHALLPMMTDSTERTESRFADPLNRSFATHSRRKRNPCAVSRSLEFTTSTNVLPAMP